jgi:hypothetical protein
MQRKDVLSVDLLRRSSSIESSKFALEEVTSGLIVRIGTGIVWSQHKRMYEDAKVSGLSDRAIER